MMMFLDGTTIDGSCRQRLLMHANRIIDEQFNSDRGEPGGIWASRAVFGGFFCQEKLGRVNRKPRNCAF